MRGICAVDVIIAGIVDDITRSVDCACCPIATPPAKFLASNRVSVCVECQRPVSAIRSLWHYKVGDSAIIDIGDVISWGLECPLVLLGKLLDHDDLAVELFVQGRRKQVASSHEVGRALDSP